jgi:hypothetical protein
MHSTCDSTHLDCDVSGKPYNTSDFVQEHSVATKSFGASLLLAHLNFMAGDSKYNNFLPSMLPGEITPQEQAHNSDMLKLLCICKIAMKGTTGAKKDDTFPPLGTGNKRKRGGVQHDQPRKWRRAQHAAHPGLTSLLLQRAVQAWASTMPRCCALCRDTAAVVSAS